MISTPSGLVAAPPGAPSDDVLRTSIIVFSEATGNHASDRLSAGTADGLAQALGADTRLVVEGVADPLAPPILRSGLRSDAAGESSSENSRPRQTLAERTPWLADVHAEYWVVVSSMPHPESETPPNGAESRLTLRIADGQTGQVLFSSRLDRFADATLDRAAKRIAGWLARRPWRGHVTDVDTDRQRIEVSAGRTHGLSAGHTLVVLTGGEPVLDPDTGDELGETMVRIGRVEVVKVEPGRSQATIIEGCEGIAKGDRVHVAP